MHRCGKGRITSSTPNTSRTAPPPLENISPISSECLTSLGSGPSSHIGRDVKIETFGTHLPVFVIEVITAAERLSEVSVVLHESGYATLVCGRSLFVWKYKLESGLKMESTAPNCKELRLPPSGLAHNARLVQIVQSKDLHVMSCIAVSPEGFIRYWPNVAREGSSFDTSADLKGQECYSLASIKMFGCILATTTGSLVWIKTSLIDGQPQICCMKLELPEGFLTRIARRVSSLFYGALTTWSSEAKKMNKVLAVPKGGHKYSVYVLKGCIFQHWCLSAEPYKLRYEVDLERHLKEGFVNALWSGDSSQMKAIKIQCLDMQFSRRGVIVLSAGINPVVSDIHYAFAVLNECQPPDLRMFTSFVVTKFSEKVTEQREDTNLPYKFLYPSESEDIVYMYDNHKVISMPVFAEKTPGVLDLRRSKDVILGSGLYGHIPLLFTQRHGVVSLKMKSQGEQELSSPGEHMMEVSSPEIGPHSYHSSFLSCQSCSVKNDRTCIPSWLGSVFHFFYQLRLHDDPSL